MEWLRWILLLLGLLLIGAIYWSGRRTGDERSESLFERARRMREPSDPAQAGGGASEPVVDEPEPGPRDDGPDLHIVGGRPGDPGAMPEDLEGLTGRDAAATREAPAPRAGDADEAPARAGPEQPGTGERPHEPAPGERPASGTDAAVRRPQRPRRQAAGDDEAAGAAAAEPERLVVLYLVAQEGERLVGARIAEAFARHGLEHGELGIFHSSDSDGRTVFSVANLVEPGTFDPATMDTLSTPGLAMFMRLPGPQSATTALERMLDTARALADELDARVLDHDHSTLTRQTEQHLRDDLRDYDHRRSRRRP